MTYADGLAKLLQGDALDVLAEMPERSVDCVITSPPYLGLRLYQGEQGRVWNGAVGCEHEWGEQIINKAAHHEGETNPGKEGYTKDKGAWGNTQGQFCQRCGAWHGAFGNEPSVALYIAHLMEFMAAIKRVLKDTGVAWINLGDSYIGGGTHHGNKNPGLSKSSERQSFEGTISSPGIEPLNLAGVPQRFFLACQEQGWIVRSEIPLVKDSPMPESLRGWFWARCRVKISTIKNGGMQVANKGSFTAQSGGVDLPQWADCPGCPRCIPNGGLVLRKGSWRPTSSHEKLFMLTKGDEDYFADGEDVREGLSPATLADKRNNSGRHTYASSKWDQMEDNKPSWYRAKTFVNPESGRNLRDVWPMKSSAFTMQLCKSCKRVYTGAQFRRLANTADYACADCGGKLALTEEWEWQCLDCERPYLKAEVGKMEKRKLCRCGASDWLSHFAAYHPSLPITCILASTSARGNCSKCGMPWVRVVEKQSSAFNVRVRDAKAGKATATEGYKASAAEIENYQGGYRSEDGWTKTLDWKPSCYCGAEPEPAVVLDPFNGTASTGIAAKRLGRRYIGIDLSEDYLLLSAARLAAETPGMM